MGSGLYGSQSPSHPLTFKNWKRVQIHESRQEVVKLSEEIKQITVSLKGPEKTSEDIQEKLKAELEQKQKEQRSKLENLQYSKQLSFEDYFDVYLSKFAKDDKALAYIAKRLSKGLCSLPFKEVYEARALSPRGP